MPEYLLHAKAHTTVRKYKSEWQRWKSWELVHFGAHKFPVSIELISIYLFDRASSTRSFNALSSAMYGIRWAHNIAGLQSPTDNIIVQQIVEATKRLYGKSPSPRKPITVDTLSQIVSKYGGSRASLSDLRVCFIFLVGFAGFMRSDELIHIQRKHISIFHDHMEIYIPRRKNDQYNLGHKVFISRSSKDTCPVAISSRYLKLLPQNPDQSLVCRLSYSRHGYIPHQQAISYSRVRT